MRPDYLYKNQRIQAWLYGFILGSLGFDTDGLKITILSHEQILDPEAGKELQQLVMASYEEGELGEHELAELPRAILHLSEYSKVDYVEDLDWALGYWRDEREPIPADKATKCRACEYNDV